MALITTALTNNTTVSAAGLIPWGSAVHGTGCGIKLNGNSVLLAGKSYYKVDISASLIAGAAGAVGVQLYLNGVPVEGALATATAVNTTTANNVAFSTVVLVPCCAKGQLTLVSTANATVANLVTVVEKVS